MEEVKAQIAAENKEKKQDVKRKTVKAPNMAALAQRSAESVS